jgi:hypothetical protein
MFIAAMLVIHVCRAAGGVCRPVTAGANRVLGKLWELCLAILSCIQPVAILRWLQMRAVSGTLLLFAACRRVFRQSWCCQPAVVSVAADHHANRTEPL